MNKLKVLDLFSGIGGFSLGLERTGGFETVGFCEIEPYCRQVLARHWPNAPIYDDVRNFNHEGPVDVICGGYPCQPFSVAGKRAGREDDRHLWPAMFACIRKYRPSWVLGENVVGHVSMGLDDVLSDLESEGYACRTFNIPACGVGAPHQRQRVWIVGYAKKLQRNGKLNYTREGKRQVPQFGSSGRPNNVSNADREYAQGVKPRISDPQERTRQIQRPAGSQHSGEGRVGQPEPGLGRSPHGVSAWLDGSWERGLEPVSPAIPNRSKRLKALGNAVVPQIPEMIGRAILAAERNHKKRDI